MRRWIDLIEDNQARIRHIAWTTPRGRASDVRSGEAVPVWADVAKLDAAWARDPLHVGPGGEGGMARRYTGFGQWIADTVVPIEMPEVGFNAWDGVAFGNGRHRFSWLRDHGARSIPVLIAADDAEEFARRYGTTDHQTTIPLDQ